ncbi:MAG: hypothetical protein SOY38_01955 [Sodaliphilus sp.]|nr:hypothetical protein [Bacteroidales bacterium]MDY4075465.1 hypothetical protein [Sodaliphilus sp.]
MECFAFGGATVRFASVHDANHTISPPPSYEGSPHCSKDKKPFALSRRKTPDNKIISWQGAMPISQNDFAW